MLALPMMTATPNDTWLRHILWQTSHHCGIKWSYSYKLTYLSSLGKIPLKRYALPHPKIGELALQMKGADIFALGEYHILFVPGL